MSFHNKRAILWTTFVATLLLLMTSRSVDGMDTLYSFAEPIAQLSVHNFTETVEGSSSAWVIEFYATWCGHCQRMAPVWVSFARDIQGWKSVVRVGAVTCSDHQNAALCRYYNIWGYPTIKFFASNSPSSSKGYTYSGEKSKEALTMAIITYVGNSPVLQPQRRAQDLVEGASGDMKFAFIVAADHRDNEQVIMAQQAVLDASEFSAEVHMGWMNYFASRAHGVQEVPSLHRVDWDGTLHKVLLMPVNRTTITEAVMSYLDKEEKQVIDPTVPAIDAETEVFPETEYVIPSGVHMQDLESGLYYSLLVEVAAQPLLDREKLRVLRQHIQLLYEYIPYRYHVRLFLNRTLEWIDDQQEDVSGEEWVQAITAIQDNEAYLPNQVRWAGCMGTLPKYRGYPCSVWMTYHVLTVAAYLKGATDTDFQPQIVLDVMRSYVDNFLGCRECAAHFAHMAETMESQVINLYDGVLWLWGAHNKVNNRLQGDNTEDPNHPKVQFPTYEACPECRIRGSPHGLYDNSTVWQIGKVIGYLSRFYDPLNIIDDTDRQGFNNTAVYWSDQSSLAHNIQWKPEDSTTIEMSTARDINSAETETNTNAASQEVQGQSNRKSEEVQGQSNRKSEEHDDRTSSRNSNKRRRGKNGRDGRRKKLTHRNEPDTTTTTTEASIKLDDKQALGGITENEFRTSGEARNSDTVSSRHRSYTGYHNPGTSVDGAFQSPNSNEDQRRFRGSVNEGLPDTTENRREENPTRSSQTHASRRRQSTTDEYRGYNRREDITNQYDNDRENRRTQTVTSNRNEERTRGEEDRSGYTHSSEDDNERNSGASRHSDRDTSYGSQYGSNAYRSQPSVDTYDRRSGGNLASASNRGTYHSSYGTRQDPYRTPGSSRQDPYRTPGSSRQDPYRTPGSSRQSYQTGYDRPSYGSSSNSGLRKRFEPVVPLHGSSRNVAYVGSHPCVLRSTSWSACSQTCDTGTSSRYSNHNDECEMREETRLCQLRPCKAHFPDWTQMDWHKQRCPQFGSTYRDAYPRALRYGSCQTRVKTFWRYCGMCPSKCCYPDKPRTITMDMICSGGTTAVVKVMKYDYCQCASTCPPNY